MCPKLEPEEKENVMVREDKGYKQVLGVAAIVIFKMSVAAIQSLVKSSF